MQIILYAFHRSSGQNIQNTVVQRVCDDALEPFSTQISLEFVEGNGLGQHFRSGHGECIQNPNDAAQGGSRVFCDSFQAAAPAQQRNDFLRHPMGEALIAPGEAASLRELLSAFGAEVSPAPVAERHSLTAQIQIPYYPNMIIMHTAGRCPAGRTQLLLLHKLYLYDDLLRILPNGFQNSIFHIQQRCDIIFCRQSIPLQVVICRIFILPVRAYFVFSF